MTSNANTLWAILPDALTAREQKLSTISEIKVQGDDSERPERDWFYNKIPRMRFLSDTQKTAIIPVYGVLLNRATRFDRYCGGVGYEDVIEDVRAAIKNGSRLIVLDFDSPGGMVCGCEETTNLIRKETMAAGVLLASWTANTMASGAYWLAQSASIVSATISGVVGSVGAILDFLTYEKMLDEVGISAHIITSDELKSVGHPAKEPSQSHILFLQERIDQAADRFRTAVLNSRPNITLEALDARYVNGIIGVELGMIDGTAESLEDFIQTLSPGA